MMQVLHSLHNPFKLGPPEIWPLEETDAGALARLHRTAFPLAGASWGATAFDGLLRQPGVFGYRAIRPGMLVGNKPEPRGFVLAREAAGEGEILTIAVHPAWQGRGIGRSLMDAVLRELYGRRGTALFLEVDEGNAPAIALYRRLGFEEAGRRESYYAGEDGPATALTMRLDMTAQ